MLRLQNWLRKMLNHKEKQLLVALSRQLLVRQSRIIK